MLDILNQISIICNRAKKDMKYQDFISWINRIKNSKA
jgi:hypothetical protein